MSPPSSRTQTFNCSPKLDKKVNADTYETDNNNIGQDQYSYAAMSTASLDSESPVTYCNSNDNDNDKDNDVLFLDSKLNNYLEETVNPGIERLLYAKDRSREPLHLNDLSLDDWQTIKSVENDNIDKNETDMKSDDQIIATSPSSTSSTNSVSSSQQITSPQQPESLSSYPVQQQTKRNKSSLSVRFKGDNEAFEPDDDVLNANDNPTDPNTSKIKVSSKSRKSGSKNSIESPQPPHSTNSNSLEKPKNQELYHHHSNEDVQDYCSTCSSSSSSDDDAAYELPPRRAYGGVRISYVPNDSLTCARRKHNFNNLMSPTKKSFDDKDKSCILS